MCFALSINPAVFVCIDKQCSWLRGDKGIRTLDPLLARQVLSQLSYTPMNPAATCSPIPSPA